MCSCFFACSLFLSKLHVIYEYPRIIINLFLNVIITFTIYSRLQAQTLAKTQHYTHLPPPPPSSLHPRTPPRHDSDIDTDIARWIEERNILLQTGVYTHSDPTIQKLDKKIRDALNAKSSLDEQSS